MAKEEETVSKDGKKQSQSGSDQPDKKADGSQVEELEDGRVALAKEEFEKLRSDLSNYREATLSLKEKMKSNEKKSEPEPETPPTRTGDQVTKWDLAKREFFRENPEIREHESELMAYYRQINQKNTVDAKVDNLKRAEKFFRVDNPDKFKEEIKEDKDSASVLSSDAGEPSGKTRPSEAKDKKTGERKLLKNRGSSPKEWYSKSKEE